jgi:hypothetical protein
MSKFLRTDTKRADGVYVTFERIELFDETATPDDYLFQDPDYQEQDQARLDAWNRDDWHFIGIQARAHVLLVRNGTGTIYTLESPGLWGIENDSGEEYLAEVFAEECSTLRDDLKALGTLPLVEAVHS